MLSKAEVHDRSEEVELAGVPVSASPDVADPLRSLRLVKWLTRLFVYPGVTLLMPLDHFLTGLTWEQAVSVHLGGYVIATIAIEVAFGQAFKLRKHAAYPNALVMQLGETRTVDAAARLALPVLNRLLGVRASFIVLAGNEAGHSLASACGMSRTDAKRYLQAGASSIREATHLQQPVLWDPEGAEQAEAGLNGDERLLFVPVIGLQQPIGVLALVGHKGNGDLKDGQLLTNIGSALGLSLENLRQREELGKSEAKFRTLAETSAAATFIDQGTRFRYVNSAVEAITGYSREELLAMNLLDVVHPDFRELVKERGEARLQGEQVPPRYEIKILTKSGEERWVDVTAGLIEFEGKPSVLGTAFDVTERKQAAEALRESETKLRTLMETVAAAAFIYQGTRLLYVNSATEALTGYTRDELLTMNFWDVIHPDSRELIKERGLARQRGEDVPPRYEAKLLTKEGEERWADISAGVIEFEGKLAVLGTAFDVTERKRAEEEREGLVSLVENSTDFIAMASLEGEVFFLNEAGRKLVGLSGPAELEGKRLSDFVMEDDLPELLDQILPATMQDGFWEGEYRIRHFKTGEPIPLETVAFTIKHPQTGQPTAIATVCRDISERKRAEETIRHLAYHDGLTDLPNRTLFEDRLSMALAQARRKRRMAAVMFLDLDRFKVVNDTVGHALGDDLLQGVAERLTGLVREGDTVARVGGDEFTLLLAEVSGEGDVIEVAERVLAELSRPWTLNGHEFRITASIGIAMFPNDGDDPDSLLRNADTAMYRAKDQGRDNYKLYTPKMNARIAERLALESSLRHGLEREEFLVYYQPQVDIASGKIVGMEALVRWQHPERGLVFPAEFIPVAEETGLIVPLGAWVLWAACAQNKAWQAAGFPPMRVAVNLSARQFQQRDLIEMVDGVLKETGLEARWLQLEITEGVAMQDVESNIAVLRDLRQMGIQIAIDDFGTGHSSLSYLSRLPIDVVKIDQSFIQDLITDPNDAAIARSIIVMAHNLKLRVIAEGVETEEQLAFLKKRRCDEMQGFLFSRPAPGEAFEEMLSQDGRTSRDRRPVEASR